MKSDKFEGHSSQMKKPTMWLASEDIMGRTPVNVTIETCFRHKGAEFDQGRREDVYAIKFKGKTKQLVLNATNRKELVRQFGVDTKDWRDKTVALTVVDCKMMGKMVKGIRIIEAVSKTPAKQDMSYERLAGDPEPDEEMSGSAGEIIDAESTPVETEPPDADPTWVAYIQACNTVDELDQLWGAEVKQAQLPDSEISELEGVMESRRKELLKDSGEMF